ncbi:MAG: GTP-binding protein [Kiloniellales bacterium]
MPEGALPVLIVGGFLGAGKTTLVNRLLADAEGRRFVVFVNDFGAINIDLELVETVSEDRIALSNGCVCCSLNADFVATLADFARAADPPDAVLIEASGVADPRALEGSLAALEAAQLIRLETRVYLIDAEQFGTTEPALLEDIIDHAAASDLLLLNKADLVEARDLARIESILRESAPYAQRLRCVQAKLPLALLMDCPAQSRPAPRPKQPTARPHETVFSQWSGTTDRTLDRAAFTEFARTLSGQALRAKGLIRFAEEAGGWTGFHLVGWRISLDSSPRPETPDTRIVAIGLAGRLDPEAIETAFRRLVAPVSQSVG